jgi:hypothetical protein
MQHCKVLEARDREKVAKLGKFHLRMTSSRIITKMSVWRCAIGRHHV